jgi:phospholipid/cholesterol/gamma-HCH transport system ATP-binding protein
MIELKKVSKSFGDKKVLKSLSLTIPIGQRCFILGKSGTGKSVLLKNIVGLMRPDEGEVLVDGLAVTSMSEKELTEIRKRCGMVFQFPALIDSLDAYENVSFGLRSHGLCKDEDEIRERVLKNLEIVGLSATVFPKFPSEMSYGMQKRVSIARTLAVGPEYVLFDEPTTGMDPIVTSYLNDLILDISKRLSVTCVVVSHDLKSAFKVGERFVLLDQGSAVFDGSKAELQASEVRLARDFLKEGGMA